MNDRHERYDAIIIGTGQAGKPLARALGRAGRKTAIIEKRHVGGTCVNVGCTPTKTMVASARIAHLMGRSADYGVNTGKIHVDLVKVLERKRGIVEQFRNGNRQALKETAGVDLIFGEARFTGPSSVAVHREDAEVRHLEAEQIFINTGTRSAVPRIDGIEDVPVLDNEGMLELDTIPEHLIVVGGGYIGVEFGQMFRRFGARVTIVQRGSQLLSREDEDVAVELAGIFSDEGIDIVFNGSAQRVDKELGGGVVLTIDTPAGSQQLQGSHLLAAVGRTPNTDALQLDNAGVDTDARNFVVVNNRLETTALGIWALGDVKGGPQFTHIAKDDYRIVEANLLGGGDATRCSSSHQQAGSLYGGGRNPAGCDASHRCRRGDRQRGAPEQPVLFGAPPAPTRTGSVSRVDGRVRGSCWAGLPEGDAAV